MSSRARWRAAVSTALVVGGVSVAATTGRVVEQDGIVRITAPYVDPQPGFHTLPGSIGQLTISRGCPTLSGTVTLVWPAGTTMEMQPNGVPKFQLPDGREFAVGDKLVVATHWMVADEEPMFLWHRPAQCPERAVRVESEP